MPRDILGEYGPESGKSQAPRATNGGQCTPRDVHNYQPPVGPKSVSDPKTPGIHGDNHPCGSQGRH